jgi:hypothetical protein
MTRRSLVRRLLLVVGADALARRLAGWPRVEAAESGRHAGEPGARTLSSSELDDLVAFAEIVVGAGPLSPAERGFLVEHIEYRAGQGFGDYLSSYRTAIRLLARLAGMRFSRLDLGGRTALVTRHRLGVRQVWPDENLGPFADDARVVRTRVVGDLIGGYYASPAGWAVVGYEAYPGRCSDLARYTGPGRS